MAAGAQRPERRHGVGGGSERAGGPAGDVQPAGLRRYWRTVRDRRPRTGRRGQGIGESVMRKSNFALRLQPSLLDELRKVAEAEGVALNQLVNVAVAEKLSALRTEEYFRERAARGDIPKALGILKRAGVDNPPMKGDKLGRARKRI